MDRLTKEQIEWLSTARDSIEDTASLVEQSRYLEGISRFTDEELHDAAVTLTGIGARLSRILFLAEEREA